MYLDSMKLIQAPDMAPLKAMGAPATKPQVVDLKT